MILLVNSEQISEEMIQNEIQRLRPHYQSTFQDQERENQETQLAEWARENLIESVLLKQCALDDPRKIPEAELDTAFQKFTENRAEADSAMSDDQQIRFELEQQLRFDRQMAELYAKAETPTENELQGYYKDYPDNFMVPEMVHAAHIVKHIEGYRTREEAEKEIREIWDRIQGSSSFDEEVKNQTDCPENDGDLGVFPRGQMVQEFEDVVFSLHAGEVSTVFESSFGFHIAKVYRRVPPTRRTFGEVRDQIYKYLLEYRQTEEVEKFIDELRQSARITYIPATDYPHKRLSSVLVKPSGPDCNLNCEYCFYLEKSELFTETRKHRMSEKTLEVLIRQVMQQSGGHVSFGWQGGEPTLMGLDFYKKAVTFQQRYGSGRIVGNGLQTNGLLLDQEWAEFLKDNNFLVGISLDGPQHIHDSYRKHSNGKPSWDQVVKKAKMLLEAGVQVNVLTVVNDYSVQFPEEIYKFHKSLGFEYMQFIPIVETDPDDRRRAAQYSVDPESYGTFLTRLFDLWQADFRNGRATTSIRHFDSVFLSYVGMESPECTLLKECGNYVVVEHNGDVYSCDFFVEDSWKLGNLDNDDLLLLLNSERQTEFGKLKSDLPTECVECEWKRLCYGGCTKDRLRDPRDNGISHFCESYKMFFNHADERLEELAEKWRSEQASYGEHS